MEGLEQEHLIQTFWWYHAQFYQKILGVSTSILTNSSLLFQELLWGTLSIFRADSGDNQAVICRNKFYATVIHVALTTYSYWLSVVRWIGVDTLYTGPVTGSQVVNAMEYDLDFTGGI